MRHLENSGKVMLATGLIVAYGYGIEAFMGWYSGNTFDSFLLWNRLHGLSIWYLSLLATNIFTTVALDEEVPHQHLLAVGDFVIVLVACGWSASLLSW